jgi:hypothetical protein
MTRRDVPMMRRMGEARCGSQSEEAAAAPNEGPNHPPPLAVLGTFALVGDGAKAKVLGNL